MTRDDEAGIDLPEPGEAQADVPEIVEPEDEEGRTVGTALRDDVAAADVHDIGAGGPDVGDDARPDDAVDSATDEPVDVAAPPESPRADAAAGAAPLDAAAGAAPLDADPDVPEAGSATGVASPAGGIADEAVDGDAPAGEPVAEEPAAQGPVADDVDPLVAEDQDAPAGAPGTAAPDVTPEATDVLEAGPGGPVDEVTVVSVPSPRPRPRPEPEYEEVTASYVVQDAPAEMSPSELRVDFGAHLEANYQRLVAQMYAITLSADQAHSAVQDAYSRAWRNWSVIGRSADPTGWVRRVAVRTTMRSWRHLLSRLGFGRATPKVADGLDERTTALLTALRELRAPERRSVVLFHMAGLSPGEIAAVEQVSPSTISTRLDRGRRAVLGDTSDLLTGVMELPGVVLDDDRGYVDQMSTPADPVGPLDDRWERASSWNGGPDGSWIVSEAPPWDAPNSDEWPLSRPATGGNTALDPDDEHVRVTPPNGDAVGDPQDGTDDDAAGGAGGAARRDSEGER